MKSMHSHAVREEVAQRVRRLTPNANAGWGKMNAPQMVCHITDAIRMATGELPVASKNLVFRFTPLKQLFIYVLPMPKGLPTARELIGRAPAAWGGEVDAFFAVLDRFGTMDPKGVWPAHPAFGAMSHRDWGVLAYKHCDHHLRQFSV